MSNINQLMQGSGELVEEGMAGSILEYYNKLTNSVASGIMKADRDATSYVSDKLGLGRFINAVKDVNNETGKFWADKLDEVGGVKGMATTTKKYWADKLDEVGGVNGLTDDAKEFWGNAGDKIVLSSGKVANSVKDLVKDVMPDASPTTVVNITNNMTNKLPEGTTTEQKMGMFKFLSDLTPTQAGIGTGIAAGALGAGIGAGYAAKKYLQRRKGR